MSNTSDKSKGVSFQVWLTSKRMLQVGFISIYENEPFNPEFNSSAYEIGRQIAVEAKLRGFKTKGGLLRRKPKSTEYAWVKTKYPELERIARSLGWRPSQLILRDNERV